MYLRNLFSWGMKSHTVASPPLKPEYAVFREWLMAPNDTTLLSTAAYL
jgi:hypothetical protein